LPLTAVEEKLKRITILLFAQQASNTRHRYYIIIEIVERAANVL